MGNTLTSTATSRRLTCLGATIVCLSGFGVLAGAASVAEACPNEAARTGPSAGLPDCRAYELVTPADKSSAVQDMDPSSLEAKVSADGNRVALFDSVVQFGPRPTPFGSFSIFSRTPSGWQVESLTPPGAGAVELQRGAIFNPTFTQVGIDSYSTTPVSPDQLFQFGPPGGPYPTTIATPTNYERPGAQADFWAGATADFSHVFLDSIDHTLLSTTVTGTDRSAHDIYELAEGGLQRLVNVGSDGSVLGSCGAQFDFASNDGSKVVFATPDPRAEPSEPGCKQPTQLYERVNGSSTVDISEPNTGVVDSTGPHPIEFQGASEDGSKVFFTTEAELTHDDEGIHDDELYEYDANAKAGEKLTRISKGTTETAESEVQHEYVIVSRDGSEVYFYADGQLTPDAQSGVSSPVTNIYRYDTVTNEIHYIATAEGPIYAPAIEGSQPRPSEESDDQVTPNGEFFAFVSTGVEGSSANDPAKHDEIYRYDNETEGLTCVSCAPNNAPARGGAILTGVKLGTWDETPIDHTMSEDGSYIFFDSDDELVPQDVNGTGADPGGNVGLSPWTDVYEWHDGVISLISTGTSSQEAVLVGASANGSDVFFMTHSQLVPQDTDTSDDIYDARIDGGFPPAVESAACLGDTCLSPPAAPNDPTPATSAVGGAGNLVPLLAAPAPAVKPKAKKCAKGRVRRKGRCVRRRGKGKGARRAVKHNRGGSK